MSVLLQWSVEEIPVKQELTLDQGWYDIPVDRHHYKIDQPPGFYRAILHIFYKNCTQKKELYYEIPNPIKDLCLIHYEKYNMLAWNQTHQAQLMLYINRTETHPLPLGCTFFIHKFSAKNSYYRIFTQGTLIGETSYPATTLKRLLV